MNLIPSKKEKNDSQQFASIGEKCTDSVRIDRCGFGWKFRSYSIITAFKTKKSSLVEHIRKSTINAQVNLMASMGIQTTY